MRCVRVISAADNDGYAKARKRIITHSICKSRTQVFLERLLLTAFSFVPLTDPTLGAQVMARLVGSMRTERTVVQTKTAQR